MHLAIHTKTRCDSRQTHLHLVAVFCATLLLAIGSSVEAQSGSRGGFGGGPGGPDGPQPEAKRKRTAVPLFSPLEKINVAGVHVIGNAQVPTERILSMLMTRTDKLYDPQAVQEDVRSLVRSGLFQDVRSFNKDVTGGKLVTFQVVERRLIQYVRYVGNAKIKDKLLNKQVGLKPGDPLNRFAIEEANRRLQSFYDGKGFGEAHVEILEGTGLQDRGVVFQIHEGNVTRIFRTEFVGNTIASNGRLKTQIDSKPGILWLFGGKANNDEIDGDVTRLTAYYRSLGYFQARIGRQIEYNADRTWMTVRFIIDEGARYRVRNIRMIGNETFPAGQLMAATQLRPGEFFNLSRMQADLAQIRDEYGGQGFIFADVQAEPRFKETPGELDIVFNVKEGKQFRVGQILVNIDGEYSHTKRSVVLNRLSIRPGDIVDIRKLRASERRLQSSSLFNVNPATGELPKIVVKPPPIGEETQIADNGDTIRGQNPDANRSRSNIQQRVNYRPVLNQNGTVDIIIDCPSLKPVNGKATGHGSSMRRSIQDAQRGEAIR